MLKVLERRFLQIACNMILIVIGTLTQQILQSFKDALDTVIRLEKL